MNNTKHTPTHNLRSGWGFTVGQDFARAAKETPIAIAPDEYATRGNAIGYIAADPESSLGFLKYSTSGFIRVHVPLAGLAPIVAEVGK